MTAAASATTFSGVTYRSVHRRGRTLYERFDMDARADADRTTSIESHFEHNRELIDQFSFHDEPKAGPAVIYQRTLPADMTDEDVDLYFAGNSAAMRGSDLRSGPELGVRFNVFDADRLNSLIAREDGFVTEEQVRTWRREHIPARLETREPDVFWDAGHILGFRWHEMRLIARDSRSRQEAVVVFPAFQDGVEGDWIRWALRILENRFGWTVELKHTELDRIAGAELAPIVMGIFEITKKTSRSRAVG